MTSVMEVYNYMGGVFIHNMTSHDIKEVMEIEHLSFTTPWSEESFINEVEKNISARYIVAKIDGVVVGYGGMWIILDEGHITNIAVHPDYRGMGIGDMLTASLIRIAKIQELAAVTLEVRRTNIIAQNLYRKHGFEPAGVRPRYYADNNEDAIIMWKNDVQSS